MLFGEHCFELSCLLLASSSSVESVWFRFVYESSLLIVVLSLSCLSFGSISGFFYGLSVFNKVVVSLPALADRNLSSCDVICQYE